MRKDKIASTGEYAVPSIALSEFKPRGNRDMLRRGLLI
jgi:hypothetical protein